MHKNFKGAIAKALIATLAISLAGVQAPGSAAAKKPKLSAKKVSVGVKKSKKISIKNVKAKEIKKLAVSTNKKQIVTVKKNGKTAFTVTGKKAGTAAVTAKVTVKGAKKPVSLKLKVTVKKANNVTTTQAPAVSVAPATSTAPAASVAPATSTAPGASAKPNATASASTAPIATPDDSSDGSVKPAPNAGEQRIKHKSSVESPIINNITIWGLRDNPYLETGYDFNQFGTYSGLFSKWNEAKASFLALHDLFNANTTQSLSAMKLNEEEGEPLYTIGETSSDSVKGYVSTATLNWDTKEYTNVVQHPADIRARHGSNSQTVTVVDSGTLQPEDSGNEPAFLVSGRADNWHGIQVDVTDYLTDPSKDYRISMDVTHNVAKHNASAFYTQMVFTSADGSESNERPVLCQQIVTAGKWKNLAANFTTSGINAEKIYVCINWYGNTTTHDDFYIKNICVAEIASDKTDASAETVKYSPLYQNTEDKYGFSIGGVISNTNFKDEGYKAVLNRHFSSMTIDNDLKLYSLLDQDATIANKNGDGMPVLRKDFSGERMVQWAYENGIGVRGHTLVCDSNMETNCAFFFHEDYDVEKPYVTKEVLLERLRSIIKQTIIYFEERYPGTIHTWDVVNEAIDAQSAEKGDARKIQTANNIFYNIIGRDYVEYSFLFAREAVNELKAKYPDRDINIQLFYNDFLCYSRVKRDAICALVQSINDFGEENGVGKLIDGVGMQSYLGSSTSEFDEKLLETNTKKTADSIPNAIFKFADLGMNVQFTELTVRNYDESKDPELGEYYKKLMQMAIDINNGTMKPVLD